MIGTKNKFSLVARVRIVSLVSLALLVGGLTLTSYLSQQWLFHEFEQDREKPVQDARLIMWKMEVHLERLEQELLRLARVEDLKEAVSKMDRGELLEQARPPLNRLRKSPLRVERINFYLPSGTLFLRADKPDMYGDDVSDHRSLIAEAAKNRRAIRGVEPEGDTFFLWAAAPLYEKGRFMGIMEMGTPMSFFLQEVKNQLGAEVGLFAKNAVNTATLIPVEATESRLIGSVAPLLDFSKGLTTPVRQVIVVTGRTYAATLIPVKDFSPDRGVVLAVFFDVTPFTQFLGRNTRSLVGISAGGFLLAAILIFFLTQRLENVRRSLEARTAQLAAAKERELHEAEVLRERKRAGEQLQARYKELETLHEMGQVILRSPDLDTVAEKILGQTLSILSLDLGVIRLLDAVAGTLTPVAIQGFQDSKKVRVHQMGDGTITNSFSRVMGLKAPMVIENVPQWNGVRTLKSEGVQSAIVVPVRTEEEILGVIQLGSKTTRKFQPDEMRLLEAIGNQIGVAVQKARLFQETERRNRELQALNELARLITSSLNTEEVFDFLARSAAKLLNAKMVRLWAEDQIHGEYLVRAVYGIDRAALDQHTLFPTIHPGQGVIGGIIETKKAEFIGDIREEPRWLNKDMVRSFGLISFAGVPIIMGDRVLGVLTIMRDHRREFSEEEKDLLRSFADQAAVAIKNARLFEETEGRAKEQEALNVIAKATSQSLHLNELLEIALDKVLEVTGRERGSIRLKDPVTGEVRLGVHRGLSQAEIQGLLHTVSRQATDQVFATGQPLVVNDRPGLHDSQSLLPQSRSVAWIPMKAGAKVAAVLCVSTTRPLPFVQREVDLLQAIGNVIGVALENARLFQETEQRAQQQAALSAIASAASQSLQIHEMLQNALDKTLEVTKRTIGIVRLKDDVTGRLRVVAHKGISEAYANALDTEERIGQRALEVLTTGEVRIMEAPCAEDLMEDSRAEGVQSRLWVPVQAHGRIMGVLTVGSRIVQGFEPGEVELLKAIGSIFGTAVANSRLFEETQRNLRRIQALREIDQAITSTLDLRTVLDVLMEKIDLSLPYSTATLRLFNKESGQLEPVACRNLDEAEWRAEQWKAGRGPANVVFETKTPMMIRNCYTDPGVRDPAFFRKHALVSYLGLPMVAKDEILGVLSFYTKEEHEYTGEEVEFLTTLAGQAAIAIYNARLYEETERRRREAEELARVAQSLTGTLDIAAVGEQIVTSVRELFGAKVSTLRLLQPDGSLRAVASSGEAFSQNIGGDAMSSRMGLTGRAVAEGKPVWSRDMLNDPEILLSDEMRDYQLRSGNRSIIAVPLRAHEKINGALALLDKTGRIYSESEVALLRTFADQAALALENARLYEETRTRETQLQETNRELERANQVKNEFLSVMSHELRTPLNVVTGYTSMIKDGMLGDISPEQKDALEKVLNRTNDLLSMITSILYATSIDADEVHVKPHRFALGDFLDEFREAHDVPQNKPLTLIWDYPSDLPVVETDSEKVKSILQNLIHNAIKFTDSGQVTLSVRLHEGVEQRTGNGRQRANGGSEKVIEFSVADTGIGIPKEKLPLIFEKFRQADSSETRVYGGVGLGLYIAKRFADLLGGKIEVETEVGKGSRFTVSIPCVIDPSTITSTGDREHQELDQQGSNYPVSSGSSLRSGS